MNAPPNNPPRLSVSLIVPTYQEAKNLPELIRRIDAVRKEHNLDLEMLIMDDNSRDGTFEYINSLLEPWIRLIVRTQDRGLSPAVIDGFKVARNDVLMVCDADLSHPVEAIPEMLAKIETGHDFVIGSRYIKGGSTEDSWGLFRKLNSRAAGLLARPLTKTNDPMSGFFALRYDTYKEAAETLNPVGYKIGLELLVKCRCTNPGEVPIHFVDRVAGESKLSLAEQLRYIKHLRRLYIFRFPERAAFLQFAVVGSSGVIVSQIVLAILQWQHLLYEIALAISIAVAMLSNFTLNRITTFSYAKHRPLLPQLVGFCAVCSLGASVSWLAGFLLQSWFVGEDEHSTAVIALGNLAALIGVIAGMTINYLMNRHFVFSRKERNTPTISS